MTIRQPRRQPPRTYPGQPLGAQHPPRSGSQERPLIAAALALAFGVLLALSNPSAAQPVAVTDLEGRRVQLPTPAERVVTIPIPLASTLIAMDGSTKRLVGMNAVAKSAVLEGILGRIFPEARDIRSDIVGESFMPNVEALAATRPDLVLQWGGRGDDIVRPLTNAGLPVALILCCREEWTRSYDRMLAAAIGRPERAAENEAWRDRVMAEIKARSASLPKGPRPRVLHLQRALSGFQAAGKGTYNGWVIELAGGENAAAELADFKPVNAEQIAAWDPDVILLNSFEDKLETGFILNHPVLSQTKAARSNRVYKMPLGGYRWDPPSHESPLTWMWLANLLHPQVYQFDLRAAMREAYQMLYGHRLTDADIDEILRIGMQGRAAHYAQFLAR